MSRLVAGLAPVLALLTPSLALLTPVLASPPADPPAACIPLVTTVAQVRADHGAVADVTYQPLVVPPAPASAHLLDLGPKVAVPAGTYECSVSYDGLAGELSLLLLDRSRSTLLLVGPMTGGGPMEDVFATVGSDRPPAERVEHTRRLFGKAPDLLDLELLAWGTDASKFTCSAQNLDQATREAIVLVLKTVASTGEVRAHREVGFPESLLLRRTMARGHQVDYRWRVGATPWSYSVTTPDPAVAEAATALLATLGGSPPPPAPLSPRCAEVVALVKSPGVEAAQALRERAQAAGEVTLVRGLDAYLGKVKR